MSQAAGAATDPQYLGLDQHHRAWGAQHFALPQHTGAVSTPHFQHQQQAMAGNQTRAGHQHQTSAAPRLLQGFGSEGSLTDQPQVATGYLLRQQLALHSAPGVPGQPLPHGLFTQAGGMPLTGYSSSFAAGAGMGQGWGAGAGQVYACWQQQQQSGGMTAAGGAYAQASVGFGGTSLQQQQQHVGHAGCDGMDVDPSNAADAVAVRLGQFGHNLQQQQQHYVVQDSMGYGRDQGTSRVYDAVRQEDSSKERETGFLAGLQNLVRKR